MSLIDPGGVARATQGHSSTGLVPTRRTDAWSAVSVAAPCHGGQEMLPIPERALAMRTAQIQQPDPRPAD
ncbi:MAG TPA: hypothetical protein VLJ86_00880 [Ramlibacter sp.]|nr:hypothetical protein [Ramlibacter sp.]